MKQSKLIHLCLTFCGLLLLTVSGLSAAQGAGSQWTKLGALPAGSWSVTLDPANPQALYLLSAGGVSRSTDGGNSWANCNSEARSLRLVAPQAGQAGPTSLYATTARGLRQSDDSCATWKDVPAQNISPNGAHIRWLAPYPNNRQILYAGMDGLGGLYRSTDSGATWHPASGGLPPSGWVTALAADPKAPSRIIVGLRYARGYHPPAYIYNSTDGGLTWKSASLGMHLLPNNQGEIIGLAWSGPNLFAATATDGLFVSTDSGDSWSEANMPRNITGPTFAVPGAPPGAPQQATPLPINYIMSSSAGALLIDTSEGAYQSLDGSATWIEVRPDAAQNGALLVAIEPTSGRIVAGNESGAWASSIQASAMTIPSPTAATIAQLPPTPPPTVPLPTSTPVPPTATLPPSPTPTIAMVAGLLPSDKAQPGDPALYSYFPQTGHNIGHGFRDFWLSNGGLAQFGYPLTEEFVENGITVQYFERARLEYQNSMINLGRLGAELTAGTFYRPINFFPSTDTNVYFGPTGHSVSGPFLTYWRDNGGLTTFGFPLSESIKADGSEYQWFERARLEWHSYLPQGKQIVLGQIGREALQKRGWIK